MKNILNLALVFILFFNIDLVLSHSGGLNSKGCHNNSKIGDYYCHIIKQKTYIKKYDRKIFKYKSYLPNTDIGFYTKFICDTNIDHVVSLKDAYDSGGKYWNNELKELFANDKHNHVPSCLRVNSSKGSSTPSDFLRKSSDGKGMEYNIKSFCSYLGIYYQVKIKYNLSFNNNKRELFSKCELKIK